jgi:hypothetical protein
VPISATSPVRSAQLPALWSQQTRLPAKIWLAESPSSLQLAVLRLQVALQALAAAGDRARVALLARWWTLRAVIRVLAAPDANNAACAVGLLGSFVAAPGFPEALGPWGAAALAAALQRGMRQPEPGAAAAAANLAAAAAAHAACREAFGNAGVAAALRDAAHLSPDAALRAAAAAALAALAAPLPPPPPPGPPVSAPDEQVGTCPAPTLLQFCRLTGYVLDSLVTHVSMARVPRRASSCGVRRWSCCRRSCSVGGRVTSQLTRKTGCLLS